VTLNYSTNRPNAKNTFSIAETTPEALRVTTLMEIGNNTGLSTIKFKVDYDLNPSLKGKVVKVKFTSKH
jgi:hypothetical protein